MYYAYIIFCPIYTFICILVQVCFIPKHFNIICTLHEEIFVIWSIVLKLRIKFFRSIWNSTHPNISAGNKYNGFTHFNIDFMKITWILTTYNILYVMSDFLFVKPNWADFANPKPHLHIKYNYKTKNRFDIECKSQETDDENFLTV